MSITPAATARQPFRGIVGISPARYIRLPLFETVTGYTEKAVRRKIDDGIWLEGKEYMRAPDGHILVDLEGYYKWVENQRQAG
ncbi:excisionase [Neopusillimonas aromaticivorans]|uniref:excisionase n=1 Tax=Neopusillimonas aromaticivorans TaxID=2979868 RepID=UPI00259435AC|nr:excisionase [Neopusillimonas aromaticivorans]WJJ94045.1 excisionase [Neopusillimonas aromaticivorans]